MSDDEDGEPANQVFHTAQEEERASVSLKEEEPSEVAVPMDLEREGEGRGGFEAPMRPVQAMAGVEIKLSPDSAMAKAQSGGGWRGRQAESEGREWGAPVPGGALVNAGPTQVVVKQQPPPSPVKQRQPWDKVGRPCVLWMGSVYGVGCYIGSLVLICVARAGLVMTGCLNHARIRLITP